MNQRTCIGLEEARAAVDAMLEEALKRPFMPEAVAVVDPHGMLVCYAAMDGCNPFNQIMAIKKARTAVWVGVDTSMLRDGNKMMGRDISEFGTDELTTVQGGICVKNPETRTTICGIGTSGRTADADEAIARAGANAIKI